MKTLADIKKDDEDDNDRERYYAGGEKSGIQIQDPNAKRTDPKDIVSNVFEAAKKYVLPPSNNNQIQHLPFVHLIV
jgi:UBX domain-containing protein 1